MYFLQILIVFGLIRAVNQHNKLSNYYGVYQEMIKNAVQIDVNYKIVYKSSELLSRLFTIKPQNGFFHARLNATIPFFLDLRICNSPHNYFGSLQKSKLCRNNSKSYGFTCYNISKTNYEKQCSFHFCLDDELFGRGEVACD